MNNTEEDHTGTNHSDTEVNEAEEVEAKPKEPETKEELLTRLLTERLGEKLEEMERVDEEHQSFIEQSETEMDGMKEVGNVLEEWGPHARRRKS